MSSSFLRYFYLGTKWPLVYAYHLLMFFEAMHPTWQNWLVQQKPMLEAIEHKVLAEAHVTPDLSQVMRAFEMDPANIKVVILGQDPYPTEGDAIGLAFAMNPESKMPRSLVNIVKELGDDLGLEVKTQADLSKWSNQGVLLLNRTLTTQKGKAGAHSKLGWDQFTREALIELANRNKLVFILWGSPAISLGREVSEKALNSMLIESVHPSPLSAYRGFFGSKPFSKTNEHLVSLGLQPIDWSV
jgi:uracil-DNA glycosylase